MREDQVEFFEADIFVEKKTDLCLDVSYVNSN